MMTRFILCKRQPSKKAWMVEVNGFVKFIPRSFNHVVDDIYLSVELPNWYKM